MSGCIGFFYKGYFPREGDFGCFIPERALHSAAALNTFLDSVIMTHANERPGAAAVSPKIHPFFWWNALEIRNHLIIKTRNERERLVFCFLTSQWPGHNRREDIT